jgi:hypothetical protein
MPVPNDKGLKQLSETHTRVIAMLLDGQMNQQHSGLQVQHRRRIGTINI